MATPAGYGHDNEPAVEVQLDRVVVVGEQVEFALKFSSATTRDAFEHFARSFCRFQRRALLVVGFVHSAKLLLFVLELKPPSPWPFDDKPKPTMPPSLMAHLAR